MNLGGGKPKGAASSLHKVKNWESVPNREASTEETTRDKEIKLRRQITGDPCSEGSLSGAGAGHKHAIIVHCAKSDSHILYKEFSLLSPSAQKV